VPLTLSGRPLEDWSVLSGVSLPVTAQDLRGGLLQAEVAGRFQVLPGRPTTILDVAHNPHAAAVLAQNLDSMGTAVRTKYLTDLLKGTPRRRLLTPVSKYSSSRNGWAK
jgi:folylpolyglutamate synthase/dihydropteroate synthase